MSKTMVFRGGEVAVSSFASSLSEIARPAGSKGSKHLTAKEVMEQARVAGHEDGYAQGRGEGYKAGLAAGYQAGFEEAHSEGEIRHNEALRQFVSELQQVHADVQAAIAEWFRLSETELEKMAVQIAEKLIDAKLELDRSFVVETTKTVLQTLSEADRARIRVNPFDSVILEQSKQELLASCAGLRGIEIVTDASIYGGCVIETERGVHDASIETRLELLKGGMEDAA